MMNTPPLNTSRLLLRPLTTSDAADLFTVYSHPNAMRYLHTPAHASIDDTRTLIQQEIDSAAIQWVICLPDSERAIGMLGYIGTTGVPGMVYPSSCLLG